MSSIAEQQTTTELAAMRHRCRALEETCGQALRLLTIAKLPSPATDEQIAAWHQANARLRARYALVVSGKDEQQ